MKYKPNGCCIFVPCTYFGIYVHFLITAFTNWTVNCAHCWLPVLTYRLTRHTYCKIIYVFCLFPMVSWSISSLSTYQLVNMYDNLTCSMSTRLNGPGKTWKQKWSWKVLENAHEKVLESHGKPLSLFRTHSVYRLLLGQWIMWALCSEWSWTSSVWDRPFVAGPFDRYKNETSEHCFVKL